MPIELPSLRSGTTLADLRTELGRVFDDQSDRFYRKVDTYANEVYQEIASRPGANWPWLISSDTFLTTAGLAEYPLNADAEAIIGPLIITGQRPVRKTDLSFLRGMQGRTPAAGSPEYYAQITKTAIVLYPTPADSLVVAYDYETPIVPLINDTDTPVIPVSDQWVWRTGVEARLRLADDRNDKGTMMLMQKFEQGILGAILKYRKGMDVRRVPERRPPVRPRGQWI